MLEALIVDRFKIVSHYEERPLDAWTLTAVKPKLAKADPAGRTGCIRERRTEKSTEPSQRLICRNITMAQFANRFPLTIQILSFRCLMAQVFRAPGISRSTTTSS